MFAIEMSKKVLEEKMKKLLVILIVVICSILSAQNAVWESPKPFVLGDNIELQLLSIKTSDGNTIFFWSKTELDGRIIYAMKLNEQGEYQWAEGNKIVLEKEPLVTLKDIIKLENNYYVLHFKHQDHKYSPIDHIYTIMNDNGNMLWDEGFSLQDYNDALHPVSQVKDLISGFNVLCHNTDNDETTMIHFDLSGNFTILDVSGYSYANHHFQMTNYNNHYYILYEEDSELIFSKLDGNFEPVNTSIIPLNVTIYRINLYPFDNEFYIVEDYNQIFCKISESGNLIWINNLNTSYYRLESGITVNGDLFILGNYFNDTIDYYLINSNGYIEVESSILQELEMSNHNFYLSYDGENKINVIVASVEDDIYCYLAQTVDIDGTLTYPTDGLQLGINSELQSLVLNSYPEKFTFLFLYVGEDRKTYLEINTYNDNGTQIIPEDQTLLETSFVSFSWQVCSQYLEDENNILVAFVSNRADYWACEVYIQKIDQLGNLLYEEEGRYLNTYDDIRDIFIDENGFVFVIYKYSDIDQTLKCDVFNHLGEFVRTYILDDNINDYSKVHHKLTDNGIVIGWFNRNTNTLKIHKFDENDFLWDCPISLSLPTSYLMSFNLTENYILYRFSSSPEGQKFYRFEDDGSISPGWQNGFNTNNIENLSRIVKIAQANDNIYFLGRNLQDEYQLFGINSDQQVLFEDLGIIISYAMTPPDLLVDDNIYFAYRDTTLQCAVVEKYDMSGQNLWLNNALMWDFANGINPVLFRTGANGLSVLISPTGNILRFASMDLDGNSFTPFEGEIVTESRGGKWFAHAHEMDNGQIMFIWTDYCVSNLIYDPDYNAIAGQLYDFSALSNDNYSVPSTHLFYMSNFPNPFNPTTTISFSILDESNVEISIYNMKGQKVKQLINDHLSSGQHTIEWNGTDGNNKSVASGIYFYKISTGKSSAMKKMLLLK